MDAGLRLCPYGLQIDEQTSHSASRKGIVAKQFPKGTAFGRVFMAHAKRRGGGVYASTLSRVGEKIPILVFFLIFLLSGCSIDLLPPSPRVVVRKMCTEHIKCIKACSLARKV